MATAAAVAGAVAPTSSLRVSSLRQRARLAAPAPRVVATSAGFAAPTSLASQASSLGGGVAALRAARRPALQQRGPPCGNRIRASAASSAAGDAAEALDQSAENNKSLITGGFFFAWYFLNVVFNIVNKQLYNYFPFPYFVSVVHLVVGVAYCLISWALGVPKRAVRYQHPLRRPICRCFLQLNKTTYHGLDNLAEKINGQRHLQISKRILLRSLSLQPIDRETWTLLAPVAVCHALGHVMTNVSFAAVAVSFTHTIKALEPFFNAAASQFVLGQSIPLPLWLSLAPVVLGVSLASLTELSFNWKGFITAMTANLAFTYRNIYSKKAMSGMDSTNVYAYISILSLALCIPPAIIMEGPAVVNYGWSAAIAKVGQQKFFMDLLFVGLTYHLYNQLANNTLERVAPLTHAVGNVLKRVFVIGFSIIVFGNRISTQTGIGTAIAISGVAAYSYLKANAEEAKRKPSLPGTA
eukprot:SM000034S12711  [mRNA]  locus=s34:332971:336264:- [translate_table: standard]